MRLLVCGGRDFEDKTWLEEVLDRIHTHTPVSILIEGEALGADTLARNWAWDRGVHVAAVFPMWQRYGKRAGPLRNEAMLKLRPDKLIAFPGGGGTKNMVETASTYKANGWEGLEDLEIFVLDKRPWLV